MNTPTSVNGLKAVIVQKTHLLEQGLEEQKPHAEVLPLYKELKELQYQLTLASLQVEFQP